MREIKFRAWYVPEKTMCDWSFILSEFDHYDKPLETTEDWKVMQYTGLKDKDGKEIYEGDVVKINNLFINDDMPFEVLWLEDKACWFLRASSIGHKFDADHIKEVIGNIYENPELIKEEI